MLNNKDNFFTTEDEYNKNKSDQTNSGSKIDEDYNKYLVEDEEEAFIAAPEQDDYSEPEAPEKKAKGIDKKKRNKIIIIVLISILAAIIIGVGAVVAYLFYVTRGADYDNKGIDYNNDQDIVEDEVLDFAAMGDEAFELCMKLAKQLRDYGYYAEYDLMDRGLKAQMKYANKIGAAFTVVIGDNEIAEGKAKLKNMESGEEYDIPLGDKFLGTFDTYFVDKIMGVFEGVDNPIPL